MQNTVRAILSSGASLAIMLTVASGAVAQTAAGATDQPSPMPPSTATPQEKAVAETGTSSGVGDIVVTARRVNENAQRVPVALTAVGSKQLTEAGITSIGQIQKVAPAIEFQQGPSNTTGYIVGIRGQTATETVLTQDPSVGIYLDGVYIPRTAGLRGALVDIDRVEILRGPQGTLYGRNTTGGAVSTYTADPVDKLGGYVRARLGDYDERDIEGVINLPLDAINGAIRLVGERGSNDGYGHNAVGRRLGSEDRTYGRVKLKAEPVEGLNISLVADYSKLNTGGELAKLGGLLDGSNPAANGVTGGSATLEAALELGLNPFTATGINQAVINQTLATIAAQQNVGKYNSSDTERDLHDNGIASGAAATISYELNDAITLKSITGYRFSKADRVPPLSAGLSFAFLTAHEIQTDRYFSEEAQIIGTMGRLNWVVGGYYGREHGTENAFGDLALPLLNPVAVNQEDYVTNKNLSGYGQAGYKLTDKLTITGGVRYSSETRILTSFNRQYGITDVTGSFTNPTTVSCQTNGATYSGDPFASRPEACLAHFNDTFNTVSWLGSLDYRLTSDVLVYAKASRGFVSGGQNLRGTLAIPSSQAPFAPEKATQYEIGEKADLFDRHLRLNLAGYFTNYQNIQRIVNLPPGTVQAVINAASAHIYGFEAEAILRPTRQLTLNGSLSYTHAQYRQFIDPVLGDRSDEPFSFPRWTYTIAANYYVDTGLGRVTANANWHYISAVDLYPSVINDDQVTQKGYGLLDARLTLHVDRWNSDIALYVQNLTNKYYKVGANGLDNFVGYNSVSYGQPRTFGAELTFNF
jgi:iron complex outermembrane receptor protein